MKMYARGLEGMRQALALPVVTGIRPAIVRTRVPLNRCISLFGSTSGPIEDEGDGKPGWRKRHFIPALQQLGMDAGEVDRLTFNPKKSGWKPEDAITEATHFAQDQVMVFYLSDESNGITSLAEIGAAVFGAMIRGQKVFICIANPAFGPLAQGPVFARDLLRAAIGRHASGLPAGVVSCHTIADMARKAYAALISTEPLVLPELPLVSHDLVPVVFLTGTSGETYPAYRRMVEQHMQPKAVTLIDSYTTARFWNDWSALQTEAELKRRAAVILHCITNDTPSLGAIAETYALIAQAYENGQRIVVYLEEGWKQVDFSSDAQTNKDARNARSALEVHMTQLVKEHPKAVTFFTGPRDQMLTNAADAATNWLALYQNVTL